MIYHNELASLEYCGTNLYVGIETFGKNAVICGRSKNIGLPIALLLHADGAGETEACQFHLFAVFF